MKPDSGLQTEFTVPALPGRFFAPHCESRNILFSLFPQRKAGNKFAFRKKESNL
jgi:hypothetical protein